MSSRHTNLGQRSSIHDANSKLTEDWIPLVVNHISRLPDTPECNYLRDQFMTKFVSTETAPSDVRRQRAINKWLAVERNNEGTNVRLLTTHGDYNIMPRVRWTSFMNVAKGICRDILGETVPLDALFGGFSGGASTSKSRAESHPASKFLGKADVTPAARPWFELMLESCPGWGCKTDLDTVKVGWDSLLIREVPGNILFTVPKTSEIDRCAAKEPDLNMYLQKGVGNFIRRSLRRNGINLNDQTINQQLARVGSITGDLATIDLSSASDSLCSSLVELILPDQWFSLMNSLRSPTTLIDGEIHVNEMFSSMGNGFTFELESLLFYVIARTCAYFQNIPGVISVYGDDIICPSELAQPLMWVLGYCGFEANASKSFYSGPFRESCGGHYHNGYDITPFYIRKPLTRLTDLIHLGNQIRKWSSQNSVGIASPLLEDLWIIIRDAIPKCFWGGREYGSISQLVTPDLPKRRLVPKTTTKSTKLGGYIHWLSTTWARGTSGMSVETSALVEAGTKYRSRPIQPRGWCSHPVKHRFLSELVT